MSILASVCAVCTQCAQCNNCPRVGLCNNHVKTGAGGGGGIVAVSGENHIWRRECNMFCFECDTGGGVAMGINSLWEISYFKCV